MNMQKGFVGFLAKARDIPVEWGWSSKRKRENIFKVMQALPLFPKRSRMDYSTDVWGALHSSSSNRSGNRQCSSVKNMSYPDCENAGNY